MQVTSSRQAGRLSSALILLFHFHLLSLTWKDAEAPWAVICSVLVLAVSFLKDGDFSHVVVFQLSLVETNSLLYYKENQAASHLQVIILRHRNALLIQAVN